MSLVGFDVCFGWVCFVVGAGMLVPVPNGCFEGLGHLIIVVKKGACCRDRYVAGNMLWTHYPTHIKLT